MVDARLEALQQAHQQAHQQALHNAEHRAQAAGHREQIAQQTISRLLALHPASETVSAQGTDDAAP